MKNEKENKNYVHPQHELLTLCTSSCYCNELTLPEEKEKEERKGREEKEKDFERERFYVKKKARKRGF